MRRYETIFIADPDIQESVRTTLFDKFKNLIAQEKGILIGFDEWGNRKLAYEIMKKSRGHYVCMTYGGDGDLIKELERHFRLDDKILKFMTILLEKDVSPETFKQELEAEAAAREEETKTVETAETAATTEETEETEETPTEDAPSEDSSDTEAGEKTEESIATEEEK